MNADDVLTRVLARPIPPGGTRVLAIDGPSGSGKSTLARELAARASAPVVAMDYLYDGWTGLEAGVDLLVSAVLAPLAEGRPGRYPRYDWLAGAYGEEVEVPASPLVVVEGVGAGARRCAALLSLLVWVEAPQRTRLQRAVDRDGIHQTGNLRAWQLLEDAHHRVEGTRGRADIVVAT